MNQDSDARPEAGRSSADAGGRIAALTLDHESLLRRSAEVEHERAVAIYDLLEANAFSLEGPFDGPYHLHLSVEENRLILDVRDGEEQPLRVIQLSLTPFRRIVRDYFQICDSYYDAIKRLSPSQIEAIDMGRRGLHDEGARILETRLAGKAYFDFQTARRLFTLICVLHIKV
jgi:uncharacterized protein (UPF0262 family)